jgi:hypothetical protein
MIDDLHPPIAASGLYWVVRVPAGGVTISADGRTATLAMANVPIVDQPRWPAIDASATPATMTFKVVWMATNKPIGYKDSGKQFRVNGHRATAALEASVEVPSQNFSWRSDPITTSRGAFAIMGKELNGKYYAS